ncbi:helix-turn-helix domain-containing protein [Paenibacillus sp. FSL W8-1287]|uniref:helix-turn-helix domain-containing protein n=1 Tax=Paenibacillus sp. FSL W8-1287 TaxID=2954653 RepID=UPI0030CE9753
MATYRIKKSGNKAPPFTRILNESLHDERLSFKARGLLAYMLSKPDNYRFYIDELTKHTTEGKDSIRAGLKELEQLGYIKRYSVKDSRGKIMSWEIDIYESPSLRPESGFPVVENPTLVTNDYLITNDKRFNKYIALTSDDNPYIKTYLKYFELRKGKKHMRITEEQGQWIQNQVHHLVSNDVTLEEWEAQVRDHFENLPRNNNGNIIAFLHAAPRRFEVGMCDQF